MKKLGVILIFVILLLPVVRITSDNQIIINVIDKIFLLFDNKFTYIILFLIFFFFIVILNYKNRSKLIITEIFKMILLMLLLPVLVLISTYLYMKFKINLVFFFIFILILLIVYSIYEYKKRPKKVPEYKFSEENRFIYNSDVCSFSEIPCKNNIFKSYFLTKLYFIEESPNNYNFLGSLLLKWFFDKKIEIQKNNDVNIYNRDRQFIMLKNNLQFDSDAETKLYNLIYLSSKDGILSKDDAEVWATNNYFELIKCLKELSNYGRKLYVNEGLIYHEEGSYVIKSELKNDLFNFVGSRKYLVEFSRISEKIPFNINLYKEYLLYAQFFDMGELIVKKFHKFYLNDIKNFDNNFDESLIDAITLINSISKTIITTPIKKIYEEQQKKRGII